MKFNIVLVDDANKWYKLYSIYAFIAIGLAPDLYNLAIETGYLTAETAPAALSRLINTMAFIGGALRLVKQKKLELDAEEIAKANAAAAAADKAPTT